MSQSNEPKDDSQSHSLKPILKKSPGSRRGSANHQTFDEQNVKETFHPPNKDYGHMKIEEPPTPYEPSVKAVDEDDEAMDINQDNVPSSSALEHRLKANPAPKVMDEDDDKFEERRKKHYKEVTNLAEMRRQAEEEMRRIEEEENKNRNNAAEECT